MKKIFKIVATTFLTLGLVACGNEEVSKNDGVKIGMVTDAGTIDDKSFNQGTWDGIVKYNNDNPDSEIQYIQPNGETTQDYLEAIDNLALRGTEVIVLPGFVFEEALGKAQDEHPDITFVAIDAEPLVGYDGNGAPLHEVKENTISIFFSEQQASFLTGIASALETKTNKVGFLGGMEVPAVQKLGWGFVAGVAYANANLGTNVEIIDYIYQGTFTDLDAGKSISAGMYDKGADVIFAAAGAVGVGAITESKTRAESGEDVYVVGVDVDQYDEGLLTNGHSTILMDIATNGVGLPQENPNLSEETVKQVNEIVELIKGGEIEVPATEEALMLFLEDLGQDFGKLNY